MLFRWMVNNLEKMRLQKYLAYCGVASRRKAEELIQSGRVSVNNEIITTMGFTVSEFDVVLLDGKPVTHIAEFTYILLNKPVGFISSVKDQFGRPSVLDLVKIDGKRLYPVGRLDYDTSGLIILTDDGDFTYKLTHPSHEITKTYHAIVKGIPTENELDLMRSGILIEDYKTAPARVQIICSDENLKEPICKSKLEIEIHEGRNRQVRKMCEAIGHPVIELSRVRIGGIDIDGIAVGEYRNLKVDEIEALKKKRINN